MKTKFKKGFYALVNARTGYVNGIHYFNGRRFTEKIRMDEIDWRKYNPMYKTPRKFNEAYKGFSVMAYLGE